MSTKWRLAAERYASAESLPPVPDAINPAKEAVKNFKQFLDSAEGGTALHLLNASGKCIVLSSDNMDGIQTTIVLEGSGLREYHETGGGWGNLGEDSRRNHSDISPENAILYACTHKSGRHKNPETFMDWLRSELDKIADAAPEIKTLTATPDSGGAKSGI